MIGRPRVIVGFSKAFANQPRRVADAFRGGARPSTLSRRLRYSLAMQSIPPVFPGVGLGGVSRHRPAPSRS